MLYAVPRGVPVVQEPKLSVTPSSLDLTKHFSDQLGPSMAPGS